MQATPYSRTDGARTMIYWPPNVALPAVFIAEGKDESVANGHVRGDAYVIDRVVDRLVFRIDRHVATAQRLTTEPRRKR